MSSEAFSQNQSPRSQPSEIPLIEYLKAKNISDLTRPEAPKNPEVEKFLNMLANYKSETDPTIQEYKKWLIKALVMLNIHTKRGEVYREQLEKLSNLYQQHLKNDQPIDVQFFKSLYDDLTSRPNP